MEKVSIDIIDEKIATIKSYFLTDYKNDIYLNPVSLLTGRSGCVLIQSLLYQLKKDDQYFLEIQENFDFIIDKIESEEFSSFTFCNGLAGFAWLCVYLKQNDIIEIDLDEFLEDIDNILRSALETMISENNIDFLHGALGLGLYFLKRQKITEVTEIIKYFNRNAILTNASEVKWKSNFNSDDYFFDFGLPHGNVGVLYFLGKCFFNKIEIELCQSLILKSVLFFQNNEQDFNKIGSFFPYKILEQDYLRKQKKEELSRLGWCYGDVAIYHTLFLISKWTNDKKLEETVINRLLFLTQRRDLKKERVEDAGFCHGTSGLGLMFLNMYKKTLINEFYESALFWFDQTIKMEKKAADGSSGYLFATLNGGLISISDILNGYGGVALFIISLINENDDWNECFMLS